MLLSKGNIFLKVEIKDSEVHLTPIIGEFDNKDLLSVYARNEELLTQLFFVPRKNDDTYIQLANYFQQRGWHVEH